MPTLWIVGIAAFIWPVVVMLWFDRIQTAHDATLQNQISRLSSDVARLKMDQEESKEKAITEFIEKQDALVTALWASVYGYIEPEDVYGDDVFRKSHGVRPEWGTRRHDALGPTEYLHRPHRYPWGTQAEYLYVNEDQGEN